MNEPTFNSINDLPKTTVYIEDARSFAMNDVEIGQKCDPLHN